MTNTARTYVWEGLLYYAHKDTLTLEGLRYLRINGGKLDLSVENMEALEAAVGYRSELTGTLAVKWAKVRKFRAKKVKK